MKLIHDNSAYVPEPCAVTIGFFDGVHRGHRYLIDQVKMAAEKRGLRSAVLTFPVHPGKVVHPEFLPQLLTTSDEKIELLQTCGLDYCFLMDFTPALSHLSASEFMEKILKEKFHTSCLLIGYDHRFGHGRSESFQDYKQIGCSLGIEVLPALSYSYDDTSVSSSLIRRSLLEGKVKNASFYLGRFYSLQGRVVNGYRVGRTLGFPTANLQLTGAEKLLPAPGVYAVYTYVGEQRYKGMLNIGNRPTIDNGDEPSIEVHLLHFTGDLYDCRLRVEFIERLRSEIRFEDKTSLISQLHQDAANVENILP